MRKTRHKILLFRQNLTRFDSRKISAANLMMNNLASERKSRIAFMGGVRINQKFKNLIKTSKIMKDQKVATWEDLLYVDVATGQINHPQPTIKGNILPGQNNLQASINYNAGNQHSNSNTSNFIPSEIIYDNVINNYNIKTNKPIWLRTDRHGFDLDRVSSNTAGDQVLLENSQNKDMKNFRPANNIFDDQNKLNSSSDQTQKLRIEFDKVKSLLSKDLHLELEYRRQQQALLIRNKLLSLKLGPIASVSLEKMRRDAHKMVKDQQLLTPLKTPAWFSKLERFYGKRQALIPFLNDIGRFQRYPVSGVCDTSKLTSGHDIQHNKMCYLKALDKLCLIMASLPAYEVLEENCSKAFEFVIKEILGFPEETYTHWIRLRQLKSQTGIQE